MHTVLASAQESASALEDAASAPEALASDEESHTQRGTYVRYSTYVRTYLFYLRTVLPNVGIRTYVLTYVYVGTVRP